MLAKPDPVLRSMILPWLRSPRHGAQFCDILMPDGRPSLRDPRWVLKRTLAKAAERGFTF